MKAKKTEKIDVAGYTFKTGVDLADGRRFEAGDDVPDLTAKEFEALTELDAIAEA